MIKFQHVFLAAGACAIASLLSPGRVAAQAEMCRVADPTGTPLNIRTAPNGRVFSSVRNGTLVDVIDASTDSRGRMWLQIEIMRGGASVKGWVIGRYIRCN